jgi:hypothetical protein
MNHSPKTDHLQVYKFKPGQSGNKLGRPKSYVTILKELGYTKPVIATMVAEIMFMNEVEVRKLSDSNTEPIIRTIIAAAFHTCNYGGGDYKCIEPYMKILFGKPVPYTLESLSDKETPEQENQ